MMAAKPPEGFDAPRFFASVQAEAQRITARYWGPSESEAATHAYEVAAKQALRAPALGERSVALRRVGKRVVPTSLVPLTKRVVRGFDRLSKRVVDRLSRRRTER
jgi:hypothetical protein